MRLDDCENLRLFNGQLFSWVIKVNNYTKNSKMRFGVISVLHYLIKKEAYGTIFIDSKKEIKDTCIGQKITVVSIIKFTLGHC